MDAEQLRAWMTQYQRTVRGLAYELKVNRSTIESWRSGEYPIPYMAELALQVLARRKPPPPGTGSGGA